MPKPTYEIKIGSETFEPTSADISSIHVCLSMDEPTDSFEIELIINDRSSKLKKGDEASILLGYQEELIRVFKGTIDTIEPSLSRIIVTGLGSALELVNIRINEVYENQSAGNIVSDLAERANVNTAEVSDGLRFPMYTIDDTKNAYEHIKALAEKCGFDVYINSENKLTFKKYERANPYTLEYGKDIIQAEIQNQKPKAVRILVRGESPSSFKGADTSHWLTKRAVEGVAGSGAEKVIQDPTAKDKDTAEKIAKANLEIRKRSLSGTIKTIGSADVKLGETIEIKGMPNENMNGEFQIRRIEHSLNKTDGFITTIGWRQ